VNRGLVNVNDVLQPILQMSMTPGKYSTFEDLHFSWKCISFTPNYMDFAVNYSHYQNVSIHDVADSLTVSFVGNQYFRSAINGEYIEQSLAVIEKPVPL
jgi:hypothetical protein